MPAATYDHVTDVQLFHELPDDAPDKLRQWKSEAGKGFAAYRFLTDDGLVSWVPVSTEVLDDAEIDPEQFARELALKSFALILDPATARGIVGTHHYHDAEVHAQRHIAGQVAEPR